MSKRPEFAVDKIECPKCGTLITITETLQQQITDQVKQALESEILAKEKELKKREEELTQSRRDFDKQFEVRLRAETTRLEEKAKKNAEEAISVELRDLREQAKEKDQRLRRAEEKELEFLKKVRTLEDRERTLILEVERRISEERRKIEEEATKRVVEEYRLRDAEKDKKLQDAIRANEELRRKLEQSSQQLQGEVLELDLENLLRQSFSIDVIEPIQKGTRGADVRQIVMTTRGNRCGVILWESKRTKNWSDDWLVKLKSDLRTEKANVPVIVSLTLPKEAESGLGFKDGVWICAPTLVLPFAETIRQRLIDIAREKFISQNRGEKAEELYEYVTGLEFRQQVEALLEVYRDMHEQILKERAALEKSWQTREAQVKRLLTSTAGIVGGMRGRIGPSMPQIKGLELLESGSNDSGEGQPPQ